MTVVSVRIDSATLSEIESIREHVEELAGVDRAEFIRRGAAVAIEIAKLDVGQVEKSAAALDKMVREAAKVGDDSKLLPVLLEVYTALYAVAALDTIIQMVFRGQHAGDVVRAYRESFREILMELSNAELEGDTLVVRLGGEEKKENVRNYVDRVLEEVRSYVNLINKRRSRK